MTAPTIDGLLADLARAEARIADQDRQIAVYRHRVTHDPLTGLLNRDGLSEAWAGDVDHCDAVAMLDLDRFKQINDTHGHAAGDQVLQHVAADLAIRYRHAVRLHGDELVVVDCRGRLSGLVDVPPSWTVPMPDGTALAVTASVGIARAVESLKLTLARADAALYDAKAAGRGSACWWDRRRHPHLRTVEQLVDRPAVRLRDTRTGVVQ
ncbi:GGDEF domain-containing protein [Micromonospora echinospora]